ncbi:MAG: pyridoxal phosphate-dependent aminotransferase [Lachnospiraceae bacterium]|jgi:cystathionine beta-lyase|nr:pyridoxal phosphate-dependent aminotransferase [Lachnospiraceae bacterium]
MQCIFDKQINRRNTGSLKWDVAEHELPMWVADMDFETAPEIMEAIKKRAEHGVYGYTVLTEEWYDAYQSWWQERHSFTIQKEWLLFCTGVIPAISSIIRKMTTVGENIAVMTPVYNNFFHSILNNGRNVLESRLRNEGGAYFIDFDDLEEKLADPQTSMLILCNPHNPIGKIWDRETLKRIGELCIRHQVLVLADEIHCDLAKPGCSYTPFASISEACRDNSITCIAPTKTFNLAGIQTAAVFAADPVLRHKVNRGLNTDEAAEPNAFAAVAPVAAFTKGGAWLDKLNAYVWENRTYAEQFIEAEIEGVHAVKGEATYLLWIDCREAVGDFAGLCGFIRKSSGLYVSDGCAYRSAEGFLRMNLACPKALVEDGLWRLKKSIAAYKAQKINNFHNPS